jgi:hypothetical protein
MYEYRVGGSLAVDDPTYVHRSADKILYQALLRGDFCYVLAPRQMGKSSLRLRTRHRIETAGKGRCASIDMTRIGSQHLSPDQWYLSLVYDLQRKFGLKDQIEIQSWWQQYNALPPVQRLSLFIEAVLLVQYPTEQLFIFLDEIDSIQGLRFSVDDFFQFIQHCTHQPAHSPAYCRLTWAVFGVATPTDLISNSPLTLFRTGTAISLSRFSLVEAVPLADGFSGIVQHPVRVLAEILKWTQGQPFLTQKLCRLFHETYRNTAIPSGMESSKVTEIVRSHIVTHWEAQDEPEHLRPIGDRLRSDPSGRLLNLYYRLLIHGRIPVNGSADQAELLLSGVAVERDEVLAIANPIYAAVFNLDWLYQAGLSQLECHPANHAICRCTS